MTDPNGEITVKKVDDMLIAGVRIRGHYSECGKGFAKLGKHFGFSTCGKPFCLHYDQEKKDGDADFEACLPVRKAKDVEGVSVRQLPGGRCVTILHHGPYEEIEAAYCRIKEYLESNQLKTSTPSREVYLKGPGMLFKGNPRNYITEIQFMIDE